MKGALRNHGPSGPSSEKDRTPPPPGYVFSLVLGMVKSSIPEAGMSWVQAFDCDVQVSSRFAGGGRAPVRSTVR